MWNAAGPTVSPTQFHRGRLIDHVHLRVLDLAASQRFHRAVLAAVGRDSAIRESESHFSADERWIDVADGPASRVHLAFQARSEAEVRAIHAQALAAGGRDP